MEDKELIAAAKKYRENAYAPYSKFKVGAAVLTKKGNVYGGCNIENSSFPVTNCAERTAIFKAVSEGEQEFAAIALIADTPGPCSPCGACRQSLYEFAPDLRVMVTWDGHVRKTTLRELLPEGFGPSSLGL